MTAPLRPAPLKRRFAALLYEALLLGAVTAVAGLVAGIAATALHGTPLLARLVVSLILLAAWWWYCKSNWRRQGQTLPMRVWHIRLSNRSGGQPPLAQLRLRFIWACLLLVLVPAVAYWGLRSSGIPPKAAAGAALFWWILPWGFAWLNPQRQFLYDYLAGTVLLDVKTAKSGRNVADS